MIAAGEDELICDLAETYQVYNWKALPVRTLAALCYGLKEDSRIKRKISGQKVDTQTTLMAAVVDRLSMLVWAQSTDAAKGKNKPQMLTDILLKNNAPTTETQRFSSGAEFEAARRKILEGR